MYIKTNEPTLFYIKEANDNSLTNVPRPLTQFNAYTPSFIIVPFQAPFNLLGHFSSSLGIWSCYDQPLSMLPFSCWWTIAPQRGGAFCIRSCENNNYEAKGIYITYSSSGITIKEILRGEPCENSEAWRLIPVEQHEGFVRIVPVNQEDCSLTIDKECNLSVGQTVTPDGEQANSIRAYFQFFRLISDGCIAQRTKRPPSIQYRPNS